MRLDLPQARVRRAQKMGTKTVSTAEVQAQKELGNLPFRHQKGITKGITGVKKRKKGLRCEWRNPFSDNKLCLVGAT